MAAMTPMMMMSAASAAVSLMSGIMASRQASVQAEIQQRQATYAAQVAANNKVYQSQQAEYSARVALNQASVTRTNTITQVAKSKRKANKALETVIAGIAAAGATAASRGLTGLQVERDVLGRGIADVYGEKENSIFAQLEGDYQVELYRSEANLRRNEAQYFLSQANSTLQSGQYGAQSALVAGRLASQNALVAGVASAGSTVATGVFRQQQLGTPSGFTSSASAGPRPYYSDLS